MPRSKQRSKQDKNINHGDNNSQTKNPKTNTNLESNTETSSQDFDEATLDDGETVILISDYPQENHLNITERDPKIIISEALEKQDYPRATHVASEENNHTQVLQITRDWINHASFPNENPANKIKAYRYFAKACIALKSNPTPYVLDDKLKILKEANGYLTTAIALLTEEDKSLKTELEKLKIFCLSGLGDESIENDAIAYFKEAIALFLKYLPEYKNNATLQNTSLENFSVEQNRAEIHKSADIYFNLAECFEKTTHIKTALKYYKKSANEYQFLVDLDAENLEYQSELKITRDKITQLTAEKENGIKKQEADKKENKHKRKKDEQKKPPYKKSNPQNQETELSKEKVTKIRDSIDEALKKFKTNFGYALSNHRKIKDETLEIFPYENTEPCLKDTLTYATTIKKFKEGAIKIDNGKIIIMGPAIETFDARFYGVPPKKKRRKNLNNATESSLGAGPGNMLVDLGNTEPQPSAILPNQLVLMTQPVPPATRPLMFFGTNPINLPSLTTQSFRYNPSPVTASLQKPSNTPQPARITFQQNHPLQATQPNLQEMTVEEILEYKASLQKIEEEKQLELQQKKKPLIEELKKLKQTTENLFAQIKVYTKNPKVNPIILDEEKLNNYSYNEFIEKIQAATKVVKSMGDELARLQTFKQQLLAQVNNTQERIVQCELNLNEFPSHSSAKLNK